GGAPHSRQISRGDAHSVFQLTQTAGVDGQQDSRDTHEEPDIPTQSRSWLCRLTSVVTTWSLPKHCVHMWTTSSPNWNVTPIRSPASKWCYRRSRKHTRQSPPSIFPVPTSSPPPRQGTCTRPLMHWPANWIDRS